MWQVPPPLILLHGDLALYAIIFPACVSTFYLN
jgi:hypothetical protein